MKFDIQEFDEFKRPSRKPWLLLVVAVAIVSFILYRHWATKRPPKPEAAKTEILPEKTEPSAPAMDVTPEPRQQRAPADLPRLLAQARKLQKENDLLSAKQLLLRVREFTDSPTELVDVEKRLGAINMTLLLNPRPMPEKVDYVVKSGDFIQRIARNHGTTVDLLEKGNNIKDRHLIRAGDLLRVFTGKFELIVSKKKNEMVVLMNDVFFRRYKIGTGKDDKTPEGTFELLEKQKNPVWWHQGKEIPFGHPENILGTRWMTLRATGNTPDVRGYGIHGTWQEASIGKSESAGCVRMRNADVEELYIYIPAGTQVTITK